MSTVMSMCDIKSAFIRRTMLNARFDLIQSMTKAQRRCYYSELRYIENFDTIRYIDIESIFRYFRYTGVDCLTYHLAEFSMKVSMKISRLLDTTRENSARESLSFSLRKFREILRSYLLIPKF